MDIRSKDALAEFVNRGKKVKYLFFWGHTEPADTVSKCCLSQWYESDFEENGKVFPTAEHYMMYHKALLFGDSEVADKVLLSNTPGNAKMLGREVKGFDQTLWEQKRMEIVIAGNLAKFSQRQVLADFLINTGKRVLVEASPKDQIWGIGLDQHASGADNPNQWKGLNLLGFALMEVREKLMNQLL